MKIKKKAAIAAAAFLAMTNFSACSNVNQDVYGSPLEEWEQEETNMETVSNDGTTRSGEETDNDVSEETEGDE